MKRKLISILLALALCLPLAGSAFAEGEAETPAPGEQTETLPVEIETTPDAEPAPDVTEPEEEAPPADEADPEEAAEASPSRRWTVVTDDDGVTRTYNEDGSLWSIKYPSLTPANPADGMEDARSETEQLLFQMLLEKGDARSEVDQFLFQVLMGLDSASYEIPAQTEGIGLAPASVVPPVKDHVHITEVKRRETQYQHDETQHQLVIYEYVECTDADCGFSAINISPQTQEPHTWTQTSIEYVNQGNNHKTTRRYICSVCKATGHETKDEEHSLSRTGTVNRHYHRGSRHYIEWNVACSKCNYTGIELEDLPCPGSPSGVGCISIPVHFRVKPADGEEDVAAPEEAPPEDVTVPEEAPTEGTT